MKKTHILIVNVLFAPFSYGGATVVAEQVAAALVRQGGHRVSAVSLCARPDLVPYAVIKCEKNGVENYLINVPGHRSYGQMYQNVEITERLAEIVHAVRPDLIHAHCIQEIGTGIFHVADAAQVPVILSVHDFWWICDRQFMIRQDERYCGQSPVRIEGCKGCVENYWAAKTRFDHLNEMGSKAACITYPSVFAMDLSERSGFAPGKGIVWENGVQLPGKEFAKKQAERRMRDGRLTFGYVGGPAQIKGWPKIKTAFGDLKRRDFRGLVVEGSRDGSWWGPNDLRGMAGDWSVYPRFEQAGMDDFYAEVDVLLFMSQWKETFGLAIREALARGIAVIQTDSGGTTEHGAVSPEQLIPINAPASRLKDRLEVMLAAERRGRDVYPVTSFDEQARAFAALAEQTLGGYQRAA
jgi:glycosyltransferase involved in cell wall biosynthesis